MKTKHAILLGIVILSFDTIVAKLNSTPKVIIKDKLPLNYNVHILPPFGIVIQNEDADNEALLNHELDHCEQYRKNDMIIYYIKYITQQLIYGYEKMLVEIEARVKSGEKPICINNYTECV